MSNLKASYPVIMDNYICSGLYSVHMVAIYKFYDQLVKLVLQEDFIRKKLFYANFIPDLIQFFCKTKACPKSSAIHIGEFPI